MVSDVFSRIYRGNEWNGIESLSGPGSGKAATYALARELPALVERLGITSVLDVACGDGYWMPDLPGYLGIDASPEAINLAKRRHPGRRYGVMEGADLTDAWHADLVICRDAIQHLSLYHGSMLVNAIRSVNARFLLLSTYPGRVNRDISTGDYYEPDLTVEPFSMPAPDELIPDGYAYVGEGVRDPGKFLGLWRL